MAEEVETSPETQNTSEVAPEQSRFTTPPRWEKIKLHKFKILGGILGVLVFAGVVFGAYKLGQRQVQPTPQPTPTPTAVVTPTPDPTANWKIYTNTKYGYSIKYPAEVKVEEGVGGEERIQETIFTLFGPRYTGSGEFTDGFGITLAVINNPTQKTPMQFAQDNYRQAEDIIRNKFAEGDISKCKMETVTRNSVVGARFTYCTQMPGSGILNFSEWYVNNGSTYQIYAVLQNEDYLTTFNLMLSTFRFLEEAEGWNTYADSQYGFSFEYPLDWDVRDFLPANKTLPGRENTLVFIGFGPKHIREDVYGMIEVTKNDLDYEIAQFKKSFETAGTPIIIKQENTIDISGKTSREIVTQNTLNKIESKNWFVSYKGLSYKISGGGTEDNTVVYKLLSTFRFLD